MGFVLIVSKRAVMDKRSILNYLKEHYQEFRDKHGVEQIGIFGSYARDEATANSDIDIFVKMPPNLFNVIAIKYDLEENFNKSVDIVRLRDKMNPYLQKRILKDGINAV
jgi:predicted nucleotidyltransferase